MHDLVIMKNQQVVTSSLIVAEQFGKQHKNVLQSIDDISVAENSAAKLFIEGTYGNRGKQYRQVFMNRDGFTLLAMGFTCSEALRFKLKYIAAFNAMEKQLTTGGFQVPTTMSEALRLAAGTEEERQRLAIENESMKPKALFADSVTTSKTSILVGDLAKILKQNGVETGARRLFDWLREKGYLIKRVGSDYNSPTQKSMEIQLFEIKESSHVNSAGVMVVTKTPKVTGKGQVYFINKLLSANAMPLQIKG